MTNSTAEIIQTSQNMTAEEAQQEALIMTKRFGVVQFLGIFLAFLNGLVIETVMTKTGSKGKSIAASILMVVLLGILFSIFAIIPSVELQYVTFVISAVHRSFVFGCNASLIGMIFPMEYFGKLFGISQAFLMLSSLAVSPALTYAMKYGFKTVNTWILFFEAATIFHFFVCLMYQKRIESKETNNDK